MKLTVLGCSGSYGTPAGGACSSYLVQAGGTTLWLDCGHGAFARLQEHIHPRDIDAVIISHIHPDHCIDLYGLHVCNRWNLGRSDLPVIAPEGVARSLEALVGDFGDAFSWTEVADSDQLRIGEANLTFSRTHHPVPTMAVELEHAGKRILYTADTGPDWSVEAFDAGADLVLSEATYLHACIPVPMHISARQAGEAARVARAQQVVLTHLWPEVDPQASWAEASEAYGAPVVMAVPDLQIVL